MCSKCKRESLRREERRKERLEGVARYEQAVKDKNWDVVLENSKLRFADPCYDRSLCWEHYHMLQNAEAYSCVYVLYK